VAYEVQGQASESQLVAMARKFFAQYDRMFES
jgi:hypothetical protein